MYERVLVSRLAGVTRRIYTTGFIVSHYFFAIGGIDVNGQCLSEILRIDTEHKNCTAITRETNKSLKMLKSLCSSACVPAFYASRYDETGINLDLNKVN